MSDSVKCFYCSNLNEIQESEQLLLKHGPIWLKCSKCKKNLQLETVYIKPVVKAFPARIELMRDRRGHEYTDKSMEMIRSQAVGVLDTEELLRKFENE